MAGFPSRISRATFGPTREDFDVVPNDVHFVRAFFFELLFRQTAGMNLFSPKAKARITSNALASHDEAWAPDGGGTAPTFLHLGTGHYRLTYAATYLDEEEQAIPPNLTEAKVYVQGATPRITSAIVSGGTIVNIHIADAAGAAVNADVLVEIG